MSTTVELFSPRPRDLGHLHGVLQLIALSDLPYLFQPATTHPQSVWWGLLLRTRYVEDDIALRVYPWWSQIRLGLRLYSVLRTQKKHLQCTSHGNSSRLERVLSGTPNAGACGWRADLKRQIGGEQLILSFALYSVLLYVLVTERARMYGVRT